MYSSVRKVLPPRTDTRHLSVESKKYRTISKNTRSYSRSGQTEDQNNDRQIRKQMTSNAYNSVFNRLVKINDLKQFVKQSSQYVQFHQQQVQNYIPSVHNDKKRFSFSLKNSICSFLTRDYRFLKHYFILLQKEFPEKTDHFRHQIYYSYKDSVIDKKKFQSFFAPNSIYKSLGKSQRKINKSSKSVKKTQNKSQKKINSPSLFQIENFEGKSRRKSKKKQHLKGKNQTQKHQKNNLDIKQNLINKDKLVKNISKNLLKTKNIIKNQGQNNDPNIINSPQFGSKRRTTMQNIKIIEETLHQIQTIFSNQNSQNSPPLKKQNNSSFSQKKVKSKQQISIFNKKSKLQKQKSQIEEEKLQNMDQTSHEGYIQQTEGNYQMVNRQDQTLQKIFAMRSNNKSKKKNHQDQDQNNQQEIKQKKSKIKSSVKKDRKTVTFNQVFDINDPENKTLISTVESIRKQRQMKKQTQIQKNKKANQILEKVRLSMSLNKNKKCWRPYNNKQKQLLCPQQKEIVDLFEEIDTISNWKDFNIDRKSNLSGVLGQVNGYKVEFVLAWPLQGEQQDVFKALYLTKLQQNTLSKGLKKIEINELKNKTYQVSTGILTLLLIQK